LLNSSGSFAKFAAIRREPYVYVLEQLIEVAPASRYQPNALRATSITDDSAAGDDASRSANVGTGVSGRLSLSAKRIRSTSISSSFKGIILTGPLKFHDLRHLVLATRALVGALVVTRSIRKDADQ
jgi:hypothetical protein